MKKIIRFLFNPNRRSMEGSFIRYFLSASLLPIFVLTFLMALAVYTTSYHTQKVVAQFWEELSQDAEKCMQKLGEEYIRIKARDVARQAEMYFSYHPGADFRQMRKDPKFMSFALQKVGETGYTAMYEAGTWIFRVHPNKTLIDKDVSFLARDLPSWWSLVFATREGKEVAGYYDWRDIDGSVRKKFMVITPARVKVKGRVIMVAATTYIDEFSAPVKRIKEKSQGIISQIKTYQNEILTTLLLLSAFFFFVVAIMASVWGGFIARGYIAPIIKLSEQAKKLGGGFWDSPIDADIRERRDEVGVLARSLKQMASSLQGTFSMLEETIKELKIAQENLKKSEAHYRGFFEGVAVGLFRSTREGKFLDVNPALMRILGFPDREALLNFRAGDLYVNPGEREEVLSSIENSGVAQTREIRLRRYDGREIYAEITVHALYDETGKLEYYEGSLVDVTERHEALEALKTTRDLYQNLYEESKRAQEVYLSLMNSSADAIVTLDLTGKVIYVNTSFTKLFGWDAAEVMGRNLPIVPAEEKDLYEISFMEIAKTGESIQGVETKGRTKDDRIIEVSISASRYRDHEGRPSGVLMIIRDISEAKKMKHHLEQVERLEALATLAGGIAHDFNNLLMVMQGIISLILHETPEEDPKRKIYLEIDKQIQRGTELTRQLLGYARRGKYEVMPVNLNEILVETCQALERTRKDIRFHYKLSQDLPPIEAAPDQMGQVFMNLLLNAADAMPDGGTVTLETAVVSGTSIQSVLPQAKPGQYVTVTVADTGVGMNEKTLEHIFEPFFTTKPPGRGTGLGLSSVYGIVKNHGGYINVSSKPGVGTTFCLYFPVVEAKETIERAVEKRLSRGSGKILIVDDEKPVLEVCAAMVEAIGYTPVKASSGKEALQVIEKSREEINCVILDMIMPEMAGPVVFEKLRALRPELKIILSSGYAPDEKTQELLKSGYTAFIQKPYRLEELSEKISALLFPQVS